MNLIALISYGLVNGWMVLYHLLAPSRFYHFPFWAGMLAMGWFFPQVAHGYLNPELFPSSAYASGVFFATLCSIALWGGYAVSVHRPAGRPSWLDAQFSERRLFIAGAVLCFVGFFFQYKLRSLPDELTSMTQWSGAAVKYLFLSNIFIFGFITLWLLYLCQPRTWVPRLLVFIVPSLLFIAESAFLQGRRAAMMNLVSYTLISLWFVRRKAIPRWMLICGLSGGLLLVNAIGLYREIMLNEGATLSERISSALNADYLAATEESDELGLEFNNYIFYRLVAAEEGHFDFGVRHWNQLVFNYVPAQIVGRKFKDSLKVGLHDSSRKIARERYGHVYRTGSTATGYKDAFFSFGWFGFIKFIIIGWMMGALYRRAIQGHFLGQLLYVFMLSSAMHAISHGTHRILISTWVYFFALGLPPLLWAKVRPSANVGEMTHSLNTE